MNINHMLLQNIRDSGYFTALNDMVTYDSVVDQVPAAVAAFGCDHSHYCSRRPHRRASVSARHSDTAGCHEPRLRAQRMHRERRVAGHRRALSKPV